MDWECNSTSLKGGECILLNYYYYMIEEEILGKRGEKIKEKRYPFDVHTCVGTMRKPNFISFQIIC
jgi:hypothetical protein